MSQPNENKSSKKGLLITLIIITMLILIFLVGAGIYFGYKVVALKIKKSQAIQLPSQISEDLPKEEVKTQKSEENIYKNSELGFLMNIPASWKNYKMKMETMGGDFEVARLNFYLPTNAADISTKLSGHLNLFTISAYVRYSWEEAMAAGTTDMLGEEIGRNNMYVFVCSHINGDPPSDIPQQAVLDMGIMTRSLKTTDISSDVESHGDSGQTEIAEGGRPAKDFSFVNNSVYYWNCKHKYALNYPLSWSNNGMTYDSNVVILYGKNLQTRIEAISIPTSKTLQEFAEERSSNISGVKAWSEAIDWDGKTTIFQYSFTKPTSSAIYWFSENYGMEMKIFGSGYDLEYDNIKNMFSALEPSYTYKTCN